MKHSYFLKVAVGAAAAAISASAVLVVVAAPSGWLAVDGSIRKTGAAVDWANPGPGSTFVSPCPLGTVVSVSGSGGLFNGGRCSGSNSVPPLPPSRTANATGPTVIASQFIVDPESGDTTACGTGDPTTTAGKNGDAINSYNVSIGSVNNKTDLSNVYAVSHTRADGHPELYFGAERLVNNGEAHVDFEFLQSTFSLAPCATGVGALNGHRTQGDLLVAVDFTVGGTLSAFSVRQWHCAADPGPQPADGTVCDPAGGPEHYQVIVTTTEVVVTVNSFAAVPCGGWVCRDAAGAPIGTVPVNDLMEGGVDLHALGFTGCFNTFLPHTRVSAPFTAQLADFAGPVSLPSCRDTVTSASPGGTFGPGASVRDVVTLDNGGVAVKPTGTVTYFLCTPAQVTASGCTGGTQVGAPKTLAGGSATSDPTAATSALGKYCWRTVYTPDAASLGIYNPGSHTNSSTECFNVLVAASLPDTGIPEVVKAPGWLPLGVLFLLPGMALGVVWRRTRSVAVVLIAGVVASASPAPAATHDSPSAHAGGQLGVAIPMPPPARLPITHVREAGWRLIIPRIGVDAQIQPVGLVGSGAMASPASLDAVGWFNRGPSPGQAGDAVIDGHYGVEQPAVFRKLHFLRPGDEIDVVWPDGHTTYFEVTALQTVPADAHPAGVFSRAGPARLSLITCSGAWVQSASTYANRLIVTAMLS